MIELHNVDCMEYLTTLEGNAFDLAIVDPPYGIGAGKMKLGKAKQKKWKGGAWDSQPPTKDYWDELHRVSKNVVAWGANHFTQHLPPSRGWIFWDKMTEGFGNYSHGELAYTTFNQTLVKFTYKMQGAYIGFPNSITTKRGTGSHDKIHPTQKPVELYEWLLMNYAKEGDRILDTHLGSGSIAIACHNLGFDLVGCELDKDYFEAAKKRLQQHQSQLRIPMQ